MIPPTPGTRRVFVRNLILTASIGVYDHEHAAPQRLRLNIDLAVDDEGAIGPDRLARVVDYEQVAIAARRIAAAGHTQLVETLAERIADAALTDSRVQSVRIRVEKLDVFPDAESAGVEIHRDRR